MKGLDPGKGDDDVKLLRMIRRLTLDAFWAREPSTVESMRRYSKNIVELNQSLGLSNTLLEMGPFTLKTLKGWVLLFVS